MEDEKEDDWATPKPGFHKENDWALPPEEQVKKEKTETIILQTIETQKITYPAEIIAITGLSRQTVFDKLSNLTYRNLIERIDLTNRNRPPKDLKKRLPDIWGKGLKGDQIKRISWYRIKNEDNNGKS